MIFSLNKYNSIETPTLTLSFPDKREIAPIHYITLYSDLLFFGLSEISFEVNKYENNTLQSYYDLIENYMLVKLEGIGWFQIISSPIEGDGLNEKKIITAKSLENEFCTKIITSFGELGTSDDEQGGLDMYYLYNENDKKHSILHIVQKKCPSWTIGYVDPDITQQPRAITEDTISAYSLLIDKASELFECIFKFDSNYQTINVYKLENYGKSTNIYLSYNNLINKCKIDCNADEIKTVLYVVGGNDSTTGSNVDIISVNPSGSNYICDFSYYKKMMSEELKIALEQYENDYAAKLEPYQSSINVLNTLYDDYYELQYKVPSNIEENSLENLLKLINETETDLSNINSLISNINWDLYGSVELQTYYDVFEQRMSLYVGTFQTNDKSINEQRYKMNHLCLLEIEKNLKIRNSDVNTKYEEINSQLKVVKSLQIYIEDYVNDNLMSELKRFWHEDTYTDDTYVITTEMTDSEINKMKYDLMEAAQIKLAKISRPQVQIDIESVNFIEIPEFKNFNEELDLGNIITLDLDNDIILELRLLKIHYNWTDKDDFKLTFSNKSSLDDTIDMFAEIRKQANNSSSFIGINGVGIKSAKATVSEFNQYKSSVLNTSLQKIQSGNNIEFEINNTGSKWRRWDVNTKNYEPYQMWGTGNGLYLTQDNWNSLSMAIGKMEIDNKIYYGVACDVLMGDFILSKHLSISNMDSSFNIGVDGIVATNGVNTITINPNVSNKLFSITKGAEDKIYFDIDGEAYFDGCINAKKGHISGFYIDSSGVYYSDKQNNQGLGLWKYGIHGENNTYIAIHAGSDNSHIGGTGTGCAKFKVYYNGKLYAKDADIEGKITASSGKIGGWLIDSNSVYNSKSGMSSNTGRFAFWAGESNDTFGTIETDANFRVGHNGKLYAKDADIEGKITASSGTFNNVTINNTCVIAGRTFGAGFIWQGTPVQNNYITSSLNTKSFTECSVPKNSVFTVCECTIKSGIPIGSENGQSSSVYSTGIETNTGYFAIKSGNSLAVFAPSGFEVHGGTKKRVVKTKNYGNLGLSAYETPVPMFGDCGTAQLNIYGECYIDIDYMFSETIRLDKKYLIFLTKYGEGDLYVDESKSTQSFFVVKGTPNLKFSWEIKCVQAGIDGERWSDSINDCLIENDNYENLALDYLKDYERSICDV